MLAAKPHLWLPLPFVARCKKKMGHGRWSFLRRKTLENLLNLLRLAGGHGEWCPNKPFPWKYKVKARPCSRALQRPVDAWYGHMKATGSVLHDCKHVAGSFSSLIKVCVHIIPCICCLYTHMLTHTHEFPHRWLHTYICSYPLNYTCSHTRLYIPTPLSSYKCSHTYNLTHMSSTAYM